MTKLRVLCLLLAVAAVAPCADWDTSGNGMLTGTYYFREVFYVLADQYGDLGQAIALYGTVTFTNTNGAGTYSMNVSDFDSQYGAVQSGTLTGTYSIAASGHGFISNPLSSGDQIYGTVSAQGIFIGSSTENGFFNDIFVAAPLASPAPTTSSFSGTYTFADLDLSSGSPAGAISSMFSVTANGAGSLGTVTTTGYIGQSGATLFTQASPSVTYTVSSGAAVVNFPNLANATLIAGQKYLYFSKDGNFVFGGAPNSWDMIIGVKTGGTSLNLSGRYHQAGIDQGMLSSTSALLDTYYGSFNAGSGNILGHQRVSDIVFSPPATDFTYADTYNVGSNGTYTDTATSTRYVVGAGGAIRIGSGVGPNMGISVALQAPTLTGTGVYLDPQRVQNAASSAPYTAGIAPGELLTLYGSGLGPTTLQVSGSPFQTSLASVQVSIGGLPAPIYYVLDTQIAVIVPYTVTGPVVPIQVTYNGTLSNVVTMYLNATAPGVFTQPTTGLGYGAIRHNDAVGTIVTASTPAVIGETISVFLTGLGAVTPTIADGAVGPGLNVGDTLSEAPAGSIGASIGGVAVPAAGITYAGLAPGLSGLYQLNITLPTGLTVGDNVLEVYGPDSDTVQALIPVAAAPTSSMAVPEAPAKGQTAPLRLVRPMHAPKQPPCKLGQTCRK